MSSVIPELIETWKIARAIGWPSQKTLAFLRDNELEVVSGKRKNKVVFRSEFEARMPQVYRLFVEKWSNGELTSRRGSNSETWINKAREEQR